MFKKKAIFHVIYLSVFPAFAEDEKRALIGSDDENADDDEDEENWRKSRHEREQYLQEHRVSNP